MNDIGETVMAGIYIEKDYENSIIELFTNDLGYEHKYGPDVERNFDSPIYDEVMEEALYRLNKDLPDAAISEAKYKIKNFENAELTKKMLFLWTIYKMESL